MKKTTGLRCVDKLRSGTSNDRARITKRPGLFARIVGAIIFAGCIYFAALFWIVRVGSMGGFFQNDPPWPVHLMAISVALFVGIVAIIAAIQESHNSLR